MALTAPEKALLSVCEETLDSIIRKWSNNVEADPEMVIDENTRYRPKDRVMVDDAINEMWAQFMTREDNVFAGVNESEPVLREAYHYAVDKYFELYRGVTPITVAVGRRRTELEILCGMLALHMLGKSYPEICIAYQIDPEKHSEMVRKRIGEAKKRCPSTGKNSGE